jgi:hypothetical protein
MTDTEVLLISMACTIAVVLLFLGVVGARVRIRNWRIRRASERRRRAAPQPPHLRQARRGATNAMSQVAARASAVATWLTALAQRGTAAAGRSVGLVRGMTRLSVRQRLARGDVDTADVELVLSEVVPEIRASRLDPIRRLGISPRASGAHVMSASHERAAAHDEPGSRIATDGRDAHPPRPLGRSSDQLLTTKRMVSDVEALKRKRNELTLPTRLENRGRGQTDLLKAKQLEGLAQSPEADVEALKAKLGKPHRGHWR